MPLGHHDKQSIKIQTRKKNKEPGTLAILLLSAINTIVFKCENAEVLSPNVRFDPKLDIYDKFLQM